VRRRFGLRTRLTVTFALGAALLSAVLSVITFGLTRENLISQRERSAVDRAAADASRLPPQLPDDPTSLEIEQFLNELPLTDGSAAAVYYAGEWHTTSDEDFDSSAVPESVQASVADGAAIKIRANVGGTTSLILGVPVP